MLLGNKDAMALALSRIVMRAVYSPPVIEASEIEEVRMAIGVTLNVFVRPTAESMARAVDDDEVGEISDAALFEQGWNTEEVLVKPNRGFVIPPRYEGWIGGDLPFYPDGDEDDEQRRLRSGTYYWDGERMWKIRKGNPPRLRIVFRNDSDGTPGE